MLIVNDMAKVAQVIDSVLAANETAAAQYRSGETKVFGFLMGQCNKALKGAASPASIKAMLEEKLKG